jgi:predicted nuclease of predicted toxin-antitoxin system
MKFLLDTHMPPRLVREFTAFGHDCLQVRTLLTPDASDVLISQTANELSAIMVTKDADFVDFAARGVLQGPLVWVRLGNVTSVMLCDDFRLRIPAICTAIEAGERLVQIHD